MRRSHLSVSGLSILFALLLALWEIYFFGFPGEPNANGTSGWLMPDRLGFNLAWLTWAYLSYQLLSIPFALPSAGNRFVGVVDGMASLVPLAVVLVVIFGRPNLLNTSQRWEAAILLMFVSATDLFGGYAFNIALSRRIFDVGAPPAAS